MRIALIHRQFDADHLDTVMAKMERLGAPTIKAVALGEGNYAALEGCHRLRAAEILGLCPELDLVDFDDYAHTLLSDMGLDCESGHTVEDVCDDAVRGLWIEFED